jgi:hypothetical protein
MPIEAMGHCNDTGKHLYGPTTMSGDRQLADCRIGGLSEFPARVRWALRKEDEALVLRSDE